ncbi:MAG: hypothetical protein KGH66_03060 [Candidatus Micrarchaeota archaeon]|nr:hypothetical protein [Candidatus Micrarchaeota archaeon]
MFKGKVKPNRVSWGMWSVAPTIATLAAISKGVGWAVLPVFMSGFQPFLIFVSSFLIKNSYWKLSKFDYGCGILSILSLILWGVTRSPDVAILFAIASDGFAVIPTVVKAWNHPGTEDVSPFLSGEFNTITAFFAITSWSFAAVAFPTYLTIANLFLIGSILLRRRR